MGFTKESVSLEEARRMIDAAVTRAVEVGPPVAIAVVDDSGVLKAFERMDGAPLSAVQVAPDKAYSAAGFGVSTDLWHELIKDDGPLAMGLPTGVDRLVVIGGGYPIHGRDGAVIGGIGVSGGYYTQDMEIAQAGLAALSVDGEADPA